MRPIDADALIIFIDMGHLRNPLEACYSERDVVDMLESRPTITLDDIRPHGRWIGVGYEGYADGVPVYDFWECSECGEEVDGEDVPETHPFCHGCGAKMDKEVAIREEALRKSRHVYVGETIQAVHGAGKTQIKADITRLRRELLLLSQIVEEDDHE